MTDHEIKPRRPTLESVLCRISIPSMKIQVGSGTTAPVLTSAECAGMVAGLGERYRPAIAELAGQMFWAYLEYDSAIRAVTQLLIGWSKPRFLGAYPRVSMTGLQHDTVIEVLVERHLMGRHQRAMDMRRAMGIGEKRWPVLVGWVSDVQGRLNEADRALAMHLLRQLRESTLDGCECAPRRERA